MLLGRNVIVVVVVASPATIPRVEVRGLPAARTSTTTSMMVVSSAATRVPQVGHLASAACGAAGGPASAPAPAAPNNHALAVRPVQPGVTRDRRWTIVAGVVAAEGGVALVADHAGHAAPPIGSVSEMGLSEWRWLISRRRGRGEGGGGECESMFFHLRLVGWWFLRVALVAL